MSNNTKDTLTKKYIYEAFYFLLTKHSFDDINVCDICTKAGVSRMSFYRNFKSKEDLLTKSIESVLQKLKEHLQNESELNQYIFTRDIFAITAKLKDVLLAFKNTDYLKKFVDSIAERLFSFAPEDKINPTKKYIPIFYFTALAGVLGYWINTGAKESPEDMAKLICSVADFPIFSDENFHVE